MIVRVRLVLPLARISAMQPLALELPDRATIDDLSERLAAKHPEHARGLSSAMAIVNARQADRTLLLQNGDEVTLMLPMVGG